MVGSLQKKNGKICIFIPVENIHHILNNLHVADMKRMYYVCTYVILKIIVISNCKYSTNLYVFFFTYFVFKIKFNQPMNFIIKIMKSSWKVTISGKDRFRHTNALLRTLGAGLWSRHLSITRLPIRLRLRWLELWLRIRLNKFNFDIFFRSFPMHVY